MFRNKDEEKVFEKEELDKNIPDDLFCLAMANSFDAFMITTSQKGFPIVYINKAFTEISGYSFQECVGKNPAFLQGPKTDRAVLDRLRSNILNGEPFHGQAINYHKNGREFLMEWKVIAFKNQEGKITHYFAIQRDVTALKQ